MQDQVLTKYGYGVERINVTSPDGYILGIYRIVSSPSAPTCSFPKKGVLLEHGMGANGYQWLIQHRDRNLAMLLADNCFDVFIMNNRGTQYSLGHTDPAMNSNFLPYWDFSFHEIAVNDLPAVIDMVLAISGNTQTFYVGHSLGTTVITALLSEKPEYNQKINTAFLLAPAVYIGNTTMFLKIVSMGSSYYNVMLSALYKGHSITYNNTWEYILVHSNSCIGR